MFQYVVLPAHPVDLSRTGRFNDVRINLDTIQPWRQALSAVAMSKKKYRPASFEAGESRRQAEEHLRIRQTEPTEAMAEGDVRALVHELQVHQIELEMQNEELRAGRQRNWRLPPATCSTTFNALTDGVSVHGLDCTILDANQVLCRMLGKTREEIVGKKCYQVFHDENAPIPGCPLEKSKETCRKEDAELFEPSLNRWVAISTSPVLDEAGCLLKLVHVVRDITERRAAEESLRHSEALYRSLVENIDVGIALD